MSSDPPGRPRRLRWPWRTREQIRDEIDEEIAFHLEMRAAELERSGTPPEEARRRALAEFGDVEAARLSLDASDAATERGRRRSDWRAELGQDVRFALRGFRRSPGFVAVALLTLALGIGANTAIFSVVNGVLLRPLPYADPDRLVSLEELSYRGEYLELGERARTFDVAFYTADDDVSLLGLGEPVRLEGAHVSSTLFPLLGARPAVGRAFATGEDRGGGADVVVLSHGLWQRHFGGDPAVVGRQLRLDGRSRTVVGVMPPDFRFPSRDTELWLPAGIDADDRISLWSTGGSIVGRLRPGATLPEARAELQLLVPGLRALFPWAMPAEYGAQATFVPLRTKIVADSRPVLLVLLGAVALVLLVACVNIANLTLARVTSRRAELAIRVALGAGRGRLVRQLFTESMLLALAGGAAGLLLVVAGVRALVTVLPADVPRVDEVGVDARVLGFALALSLLSGLFFGLLPALRASGPRMEWLGEGGGRGAGAGPRRRALQGSLVVAQIALAVMLVTGAGLLIKSFWRLVRVDPGFRVENVVSATLAPPEFRYADDASRRVFYDRLLERLRALPGVSAAAVASGLPFAGDNWGTVFVIEGHPDPAATGDWPWADAGAVVSPGWLDAMGVPVVQGRGFAETDDGRAPGVVIVGRALAERYWPGQDPVGRRIRFPGDEGWRTVVGVAGDVKWNQLTEAGSGALYVPLAQGELGPMRLVVRSAADPAAVADELRAVVASVDRDTPVSDVRTAEQLVSASVAGPRFTMLLLSLFALVALALGAIGIFGVVSHATGQRRREIGLRVALGATPGDVRRLVVRQGATLTLAGLALGLVAALAVTRILAGLLHGVRPTDPGVLGGSIVLLAAVALGAAYLPARRATRVDPVEALRAE